MSLKQDPTLETLTALAREEPNVCILWLYGSRAKGTAQADSDYDLAVAFNRFPDDAWEKRLQPELLAQRWQDALPKDSKPISVVDINHIPLTLAYSVISSGKVLLAKDTLRLAREENRISSMWELDHEYHKRIFG
ncbi:type VII toxin-antitoxin system MntA family adenylyltransferase antitoxin [Marinobacterium litorale]|uniref:type VII toxin-antitoxin system MntA family adenylyltransferase antitoxin n=1 Tax=Marinobacterium litorale TaxID=404770 RepID=UPI000401E1B8|nr:nucleotidyltransferase domain-containing protein [Marinobacterium litorale]